MASLALFVESSSSLVSSADESSNLASSSSTPPTTVTDSESLHSDSKDVIAVIDDSTVVAVAPPPLPVAQVPSPRRPQRARASLPVYNIAKLSGTAAHGKRRSKGDIVADRRRRRTIAGATLTAGDADVGAALDSTIDALGLAAAVASKRTPRAQRLARPSPRSLRSVARLGTPAADVDASPVSSAASRLAAIVTKRGRKPVGKTGVKLSRELRRLQDTKEFSHIDERPVLHSVWANGKYIDPNQPVERRRARKNAKVDHSEIEVKQEEPEEPVPQFKKPRVKKYMDHGLYSGQDMPKDMIRGLTAAEKKQLAQLPELVPCKENKVMPAPIFGGFRTLLAGRDFKLPFQVCNPLPPGQPKPDEWKKMTKSKFSSLVIACLYAPSLS